MVRQLIPWNTAGGQLLDVFRREMEDLAGRLQDSEGVTDEMASFSPRTNVAETDKSYEISLDLAGMKPDDFKIEMLEGRLSISGERHHEAKEEGKTFHRIERRYGKFSRTFTLGQDVDPEAVAAEYKDGVLHVVVPKTAKAQPKRIQVKS